MYLTCTLLAIPLIKTAMSFTLNPSNLYDSWYEDKVRSTLSQFHINLSNGKSDANGPMVSEDIEWNVNGNLLVSRESFVENLKSLIATFHPLDILDEYHLVDGNVGAVLYHLHGRQIGEMAGIEATGKHFNVMGSELMVFDADAKLHTLYTIDELEQVISQVTGLASAAPASNITVFSNPQTSPDFRQKLRDNIALLIKKFQEGTYSNIANLATLDVAVNADGALSTGTDAVVQLFTANLDAFRDKRFHLDYVVADGKLVSGLLLSFMTRPLLIHCI